MAHEIEITDKGAALAYVLKNGVPWHGLGTPVTDDLTPEEIGEKAQMLWDLQKSPIYNAEGKLIKHRWELRRSTDKKSFDIVTDLYHPIQPRQVLQFFTKFVAAGHMKMESAGCLQGGRRIFALAKIQAGYTLKGGDRLEGYLLLTSPNFVGECAAAKLTIVRVICMNTHRAAMHGAGNIVTINHLTEFDEAAQEKAQEALGLAVERTKEYGEYAKALAGVKADDQQVLRYIHQVTGGKVLEAILENQDIHQQNGKALLEAAAEESELRAELSRREVKPEDLNRIGKKVLDAIVNAPGAKLPSAKGTWWGAFNAVTYATDHASQDVDKNYSSAWFGTGADRKDKALDLALEYAGLPAMPVQ